ncbi:PKD-like family lipoprotein [Solitalea sp. MAHUQ-68]|uniref:PKD-like family lipoprotein n=1 Tax=Solitalea agri TaxID=2953739 RepID=A0A9X2JCK1_9SPHI|nr:PKD-like family lipoprotein [Solitalea agri]MCO4291880.1 PKD-like family lipoprotein [Solitalea agri]
MKVFNSIILLCLTALVFSACQKEIGGDYKDLNTTFVDTSKYAKQIVARQNEVYSISPSFIEGVDPSKLTYEWRLTKVEYTADPVTGRYIDTVLSTEQNFSKKIPFSPGSYVLRLHVFDPSNGNIAQIINTPFTVSSYALQGLMLLHGDVNSCDVSILVNNRVNTVVPATADSIQKNIFSIINGKKIEGEARAVAFNNHGASGARSKVYVLTSNGGYRTEFGGLKMEDPYNNLFSAAPSTANFQAYGTAGTNEYLINNGALYYQGQTQPAIFKPFGSQCYLPSNISPGTYTATPYFAMDIDNVSPINALMVGVFYDSNSRRFLYSKNDNTIGTFTGTAPAGGFALSTVGKWMVYGEQGNSPTQLSPYFSRYFYCVMSDLNFTGGISAKAGTRKVYISDLGRLPDPNFPTDVTKSMSLTSNLRGVAVKDISAATDIDNAKYFAFGNKGNVMYYATNDKIYLSNDYQTSNLYYDILANYSGNVITSMQVFKVKGHPKDGQLLYVALYNSATQSSTLLEIAINGINGTMSGTPKAYTGISGKISAMNYKQF